MIVEYMKKIERHLPYNVRQGVGFSFFSIDPKKDNTNTLQKFARAHGLNTKNWELYSSKKENVRELAAALGFNYRELPDGNFEHQNMISVLDKKGVIVTQQLDMSADNSRLLKLISNLISNSK